MMIAHIVAAAENGTIGKEGDLPWSIPEDMKWFRDRTRGTALIMGRKTFEAVEHPLPKRLNVVVTRQKDYTPDKMKADPTAPVIVTDTIEKAIEICKKQVDQWKNEIFIIGGGEIYHQSVKFVDTIYLTRIHRDVDGDATYPDPDPNVFKLTESIKRTEPEAFTFETWVRK
jgi:dihydrofolate reductase